MKVSVKIVQSGNLQITPSPTILNKDDLIEYVKASLARFKCFNGKGFRFALLEARLVYVPASEILNKIEEKERENLSIVSILQSPNGRYIREIEEELELDNPYINPLQIPFSVNNAITGWIALKYGIRGGNLTFNSTGHLSSIISAIKFISEQISLGYINTTLLLAGSFGGLYLSEITDPIKTYSFLVERSCSSRSKGVIIEFENRYTNWNNFIEQLKRMKHSTVVIETAIDLPISADDIVIIQNKTDCSLLCDFLCLPTLFEETLGIRSSDITYIIIDALNSINILKINI